MSENGEPLTPRELAEMKVERTVIDAWLAITAASKMFSDPATRDLVERQRDDILSMRTKLDLLASAITASRPVERRT